MENYNIDIKRNIKKLMKDHKPEVKQKVIQDITNMTQPNVSRCLDEKHKNRFTLEQLIAIADYFEVSLDSIIGRNLYNVKQKKSTMQDIISALFELEMVDFDINPIPKPGIGYNPLNGDPIPETDISYNISFHLKYLDDFLSEWMSARKITMNSKPASKVAKDMYESWKREKLNEAANISLDGSQYYDYLDFDIPDEAELPFN